MNNVKTVVPSYVSTKLHCDYILVCCAKWKSYRNWASYLVCFRSKYFPEHFACFKHIYLLFPNKTLQGLIILWRLKYK